MNTLSIVAAGLLFCGPVSGQTDGITQGEWASYLAEGTGLKQNLPPTADTDSYIRALSQGGFIRKEGEDYAEVGAGVGATVEEAGGPMSQGKWLRAGKDPGKVTYRITIPLHKRYLLRARVRGDKQFWSIDGGDPIKVEPEKDLDWETVQDEIDLKPGEHAITVDLPAEGGIDILEFITSSTPPIAPAGGFNPAAPLTFTEKVETMVRVLNWERFLPMDAEPCRIWEAESFSAAEGPLEIKKTQDHGIPSDRRWILPPPSESSIVTYYLTVAHEGLYSLKGRFWGDIQNNLSWEIDRNRISFTPDSPDKFGWITIDTVPLAAGTHRIDMELKSGTGADVFQLLKHRNETGDYLVLLAERGFAEGVFALSVVPQEHLAYGRWIEREAEKAVRISGDHSLSDDRSHGSPSGQRWLSPSGKVTARFEFDISEPDEEKEQDEEGERSTRIRSEGEKASDLFGPYSFSESTDHGAASEKEWLQAGGDFVTAYFEVDIRRGMETAAGPEALLALAAEAERAQKLSGAFAVLTSTDHGEPSGQQWVSSTGTATARFEVDIPSDTLYSIRARDFGPEPLLWKVDPDGVDFLLQTAVNAGGKDSFAWHPVGDVFLSAGRHLVEVTLSGGAGLDGWELRKGDPCGEEIFVLYSRDFGGRPITWTVDPERTLPLFRRTVESPGEKFFDWHPVATLSLPAGKHTVSAKLSPESGLDVWEVRRRGWCDENLYSLRSRDFGPDPISFRLSPWGKPPILEQTVFPAKENSFEWNEVATLSIPEGRHVLEVELGENNGFDSWEITKRNACECELSSLAFTPVTADAARKNIERIGPEPEPRPGFSPLPVSTPSYPVLSPFVAPTP